MTLATVSVTIGGTVFPDWTSITITRSLHELAGSFHLEYDDAARIAAALPRAAERHDMVQIAPLMPVEIRVDGELFLRGHVQDLDWEITGDQVRASIVGYDPVGDLLDCSANPNGPAEYKGLDALAIATKVCAPFGVKVTAETNVGAPIKHLAVDLGESVTSVLDKLTKVRAILVTSDGIGGLVLTNSGHNRAPAPLLLPGVVSYGAKSTMKERYSDYYVKGQARGGHRGRAPLTATTAPSAGRLPDGEETAAQSRRHVSAPAGTGTAYALGEGPTAAAAPATTRTAAAHNAIVTAAGHAKDPAIDRYRPRVWVARTQAGGAPNQVLAEWRMRIARGRSDQRRFTVPGWRAGEGNKLWRPNEVVELGIGPNAERFDMLIDGVTMTQSDHGGTTTQLTVVGREAYDLEPLPDEHGGRHTRAKGSDVGRGATGRGTGR